MVYSTTRRIGKYISNLNHGGVGAAAAEEGGIITSRLRRSFGFAQERIRRSWDRGNPAFKVRKLTLSPLGGRVLYKLNHGGMGAAAAEEGGIITSRLRRSFGFAQERIRRSWDRGNPAFKVRKLTLSPLGGRVLYKLNHGGMGAAAAGIGGPACGSPPVSLAVCE